MLRKANECTVVYNEHMRDGNGTVELTHFIGSNEELNNKGRLFSKIVLKKGCSIGYHTHEADAELFYIVSGTGVYSDNGDMKTVTAGDVTVCPTGTGHSIANECDEDLVMIAVIVFA